MYNAIIAFQDIDDIIIKNVIKIGFYDSNGISYVSGEKMLEYIFDFNNELIFVSENSTFILSPKSQITYICIEKNN